ncbi:MAG: AraC family transcriptional regulator [Bacillota bacterium]|nr:AraC family transcriptional regulator [Bacillota bacterium]
MVKLHQIGRTDPAELIVFHAGMEQCAPSHAFGPAVREYYLFHYIFSGCGCFEAEGRRYQLQAGNGFLIYPDQVSYYEADQKDPWHYAWIAFRGTKASDYLRQAGFSLQSPIYAENQIVPDGPGSTAECFRQIDQSSGFRQGRELHLLGLLYLFLSRLIAANQQIPLDDNQVHRRDWYVRQARDYLEMNYARKISITALAAHIGLDRSYFGQLFRQVTGLAPQQYLLKLRMAKACQLMGHSDLPISTIARSVGYDDPLLFSRMFRKVEGCSPSEHRQRADSRI